MSKQLEKPIRVEMDSTFRTNTGRYGAVYSVKRHKFCTWHYQGKTKPIVYFLFPGYYIFFEGDYWDKRAPSWRVTIRYVRLSIQQRDGVDVPTETTIHYINVYTDRLSKLVEWVERNLPAALPFFKALYDYRPGYHSPSAPPPTVQLTDEVTKALLEFLERNSGSEINLEAED